MNSVALKYRLLLIALLPSIAAVLYVAGQSYDPVLIDFKAATGQVASRPNTSSGSVPERVEKSGPLQALQETTGYRKFGQERRYTKDNLYERVDGHAEYFIGAGFLELTVAEYITAGSSAEQAEIQTEVFDMGKSIQAFGVLSDESGENPVPVNVGALGYKTSGGVNFIKGRYYVKISAFNQKAPVLKFARAFADTLSAGQDSFQVFSKFPDLGKILNTRFVKEGYRGLDFLHNVVEREYSRDGKKITVALMTGTTQQMQSLRESFFDYFRKSGVPHEKIERDGTEMYKVVDKYEGNWFLIPAGDSIFGVFGTDDKEILKYFAKRKG